MSGLGSGGPDDNDAQAGRFIAHCLNAKKGKRDDGESETFIPGPTFVRRLTPRECERLQGLPDNWTQLGDTADSKRYAALGDAVTVNVAEWIGRRLANADQEAYRHAA